MKKNNSPSAVDQLQGLVQGLLARKPRGLNANDPKVIYQKLLDQRLDRYRELREAVAALLYLRNKLDGEVRERRALVARTYDEAKRAARRGDDDLALSLIAEKNALMQDLGRIEDDLGKARSESETAKRGLLRFREDTRELEREKAHGISALLVAEANRRMREAASGEPLHTETEALDRARQHIAHVVAEQALDRELNGGGQSWGQVWDDSYQEEAQLELRRLKCRMRHRRSLASSQAV